MLGEGMSELRVDQLGQCRPVGFVADVPGLQPGQLGVGRAASSGVIFRPDSVMMASGSSLASAMRLTVASCVSSSVSR